MHQLVLWELMCSKESWDSPQSNWAKDNQKVRAAAPSRFKLIPISSKRLLQISALAPESAGYLLLGTGLQRWRHLYNHQQPHIRLPQTLLVNCSPTAVTIQLPVKLKCSTVQDKRQAAVGSYVFPRSRLENCIAEHISQHDYLGKSPERSFETG